MLPALAFDCRPGVCRLVIVQFTRHPDGQQSLPVDAPEPRCRTIS
jgi:hypothetical protein